MPHRDKQKGNVTNRIGRKEARGAGRQNLKFRAVLLGLLGTFWFFWAGIALAQEIPENGILYYSVTDNTIRGLDVVTQAEAALLPSTAFAGAVVGGAREIAFDPVTRLMWYSATDDTIRSLNRDTLSEGSQISGIPGAAIGAARHVFIDYARRKLLVPITDGSVPMYNLSNQQPSGQIPSSFFTDGDVGAYRHFASDVRTGNLWYAATDGSFREMDPDTMTHTGKDIPFSVQIGANPGAYRHFVVDPARDLLLYAVTDGSIASINLTTLQAAQFNIPATAFIGANPGAGRVITYESTLRGLTVILDDGGENFGPGDRLKLSIGVANPDSSVSVDAYLVLIFPDGTRFFFELGEGGSLIPSSATADTSTWKKLLSRVTLATGLDTGSVPILDYIFTGSEPSGIYQWILAFMNAGTLDVLAYKTESFLVGPYPLSRVVGRWVGSWTNQTFGSTGSAVFEVADSSPGVVTITVDLGGNVFGGIDLPAFTLTAKLNSDGSISLGGGSSDFGTLKATATVDGTLNGTIDSIPSTVIKSADFSGRLSDGELDLNYTVNFTDTTKAVGILKATRQ